MKAAAAAAEKGIHVNIVGMGDPKGSPIPVDSSNNYMKDKDGNVVITKLNEEMCQEIAAAGHGTYVRADNTNSALRALQKEIDKMNKSELDSKVYSEYDERFQTFALDRIDSAFSGFHDAGPQEPCIQKSKIILLKCYG